MAFCNYGAERVQIFGAIGYDVIHILPENDSAETGLSDLFPVMMADDLV